MKHRSGEHDPNGPAAQEKGNYAFITFEFHHEDGAWNERFNNAYVGIVENTGLPYNIQNLSNLE